jgi:hypothetical protein
LINVDAKIEKYISKFAVIKETKMKVIEEQSSLKENYDQSLAFFREQQVQISGKDKEIFDLNDIDLIENEMQLNHDDQIEIDLVNVRMEIKSLNEKMNFIENQEKIVREENDNFSKYYDEKANRFKALLDIVIKEINELKGNINKVNCDKKKLDEEYKSLNNQYDALLLDSEIKQVEYERKILLQERMNRINEVKMQNEIERKQSQNEKSKGSQNVLLKGSQNVVSKGSQNVVLKGSQNVRSNQSSQKMVKSQESVKETPVKILQKNLMKTFFELIEEEFNNENNILDDDDNDKQEVFVDEDENKSNDSGKTIINGYNNYDYNEKKVSQNKKSEKMAKKEDIVKKVDLNSSQQTELFDKESPKFDDKLSPIKPSMPKVDDIDKAYGLFQDSPNFKTKNRRNRRNMIESTPLPNVEKNDGNRRRGRISSNLSNIEQYSIYNSQKQKK